jgi:hypothetical protein
VKLKEREFKDKPEKTSKKLNIFEVADLDLNRSIHYAAECGNAEIMEILIQAKVNIKAKNIERISCIEILSKKGYLDCLKIVFKNYSLNEFKNVDIYKSMKLAIENHHAAIVDFFLRSENQKLNLQYLKEKLTADEIMNESTFTSDEESSDDNNYNLLDLAIKSDDEEIAKLIIHNADMFALEKILINVKKVNHEYTITFWDLIKKMPQVAEMCLDRFLELNEGKTCYELNFIIMDKSYLMNTLKNNAIEEKEFSDKKKTEEAQKNKPAEKSKDVPADNLSEIGKINHSDKLSENRKDIKTNTSCRARLQAIPD